MTTLATAVEMVMYLTFPMDVEKVLIWEGQVVKPGQLAFSGRSSQYPGPIKVYVPKLVNSETAFRITKINAHAGESYQSMYLLATIEPVEDDLIVSIDSKFDGTISAIQHARRDIRTVRQASRKENSQYQNPLNPRSSKL